MGERVWGMDWRRKRKSDSGKKITSSIIYARVNRRDFFVTTEELVIVDKIRCFHNEPTIYLSNTEYIKATNANLLPSANVLDNLLPAR